MIKYLVSTNFSLMALFMPITAFAFGGSDSIQIELRASVSLVCVIGEVDALSTGNGSQLRVATSCNSDRFILNLDGVNNLSIIDATTSGNNGGIITLVSDGVQVQPRLPGGHIITINLTNEISDLSALNVSVTTI